MALMLVLNLVFMVAALAGAMLQFGSLAASGALAAVEHVRAFHAADAVMALCERRLLAARSRGHEVPEGPLSVFGRDARWPGSIRLPECAIERLASSRTRTGGYRITARGFGSTGDAQSWAQMDLEFAPGMLHRNWRPLARRPVPDPWRGMGGGMGGGKGAGMGEGTGVLDLQGRAQSGGLRQSTPGRMRIRDRPLRTRRFARSGRPARHTTRGAAGLSLIEAMIALAVAAIIAGYAMPTYRQHLARAHRLSAALAVRQAAQYIEGRRLFDHAGGAVHGAGPRTRGSYDDRWFSLPAHLARAPADGPVVYRLRVDAGKAPGMTAGTPALSMTTRSTTTLSTTTLSTTAYWIVAVPVESGPMAGDACGSFILDASGRRSNTGTEGAEQCWSGI